MKNDVKVRVLPCRETASEVFESLFDIASPESAESARSMNTLDSERDVTLYNGKLRVRLSRAEADHLIELIESAREYAEAHRDWRPEHLEIWDNYWSGGSLGGISALLSGYHEPSITIKQLLWCQNSLIKTKTKIPGWMRKCIAALRAAEKEQQ